MPREGTLKTWHAERAFGFISPTDGGPDVFVHLKAFADPRVRPQEGLKIVFEAETAPDGRLRARTARVLAFEASPHARSADRERGPAPRAAPAPKSASRARGPWGVATFLAIGAFVLLFLAASVLWRVPGWVGLAYLGLSTVCFMTYAADKSAAVAQRRRVPEAHLHVLSLLGGWPGAILAQQLLRHKSSKAEFRAVFWVTVVLNVVAFCGLVSPMGAVVAGVFR